MTFGRSGTSGPQSCCDHIDIVYICRRRELDGLLGNEMSNPASLFQYLSCTKISMECNLANSDDSGFPSHYIYPKKGNCDFCEGSNVRIRVEVETQVPDGSGGSRPAHICVACDG